MQIRPLNENDLVEVSALCIDAFLKAVASTLSSEGVNTFENIASAGSFLNRMNQDNIMLVCEENAKITGVIELKQGRHIAMLFVLPDCQKKGVGRELVSAILPFTRADTITVSASLNSIPAYIKYGFSCMGEPDEKSGLIYQPMELKSTSGYVK